MTFSATALFAESATAKEGKATISLSKDGDGVYALAEAGALAPPLLGGGEPAEAVGPADATDDAHDDHGAGVAEGSDECADFAGPGETGGDRRDCGHSKNDPGRNKGCFDDLIEHLHGDRSPFPDVADTASSERAGPDATAGTLGLSGAASEAIAVSLACALANAAHRILIARADSRSSAASRWAFAAFALLDGMGKLMRDQASALRCARR